MRGEARQGLVEGVTSYHVTVQRGDRLTLRLRQSEYDAIQRAAEQRHLPASTLARSLLLDKLGEQHAS